MYCPYCGHELEKIDREEEFRKENLALANEQDAWLDTDMSTPYPEADRSDKSEHLMCRNDDCCLCDTIFNKHHPFCGIYSKPGDSWSLSWVK